MVDGSMSNESQIFRKASPPYQQNTSHVEIFISTLKKNVVFFFKVIECPFLDQSPGCYSTTSVIAIVSSLEL
jgi:hypothetical protein